MNNNSGRLTYVAPENLGQTKWKVGLELEISYTERKLLTSIAPVSMLIKNKVSVLFMEHFCME
jgi:hypothetical protein